jgi:translation initiation factor 3 subunit B
MTETYVTWSPHGTYLGTFHRQGVILWGTEKWDKVMRFQHPGVKLLDFSPRENYLVTFSTQLAQCALPSPTQNTRGCHAAAPILPTMHRRNLC